MHCRWRSAAAVTDSDGPPSQELGGVGRLGVRPLLATHPYCSCPSDLLLSRPSALLCIACAHHRAGTTRRAPRQPCRARQRRSAGAAVVIVLRHSLSVNTCAKAPCSPACARARHRVRLAGRPNTDRGKKNLPRKNLPSPNLAPAAVRAAAAMAASRRPTAPLRETARPPAPPPARRRRRPCPRAPSSGAAAAPTACGCR